MAGALATLAATLLPSLLQSFGSKGGSGLIKTIGDMTKSISMPIGTKLIQRGLSWIGDKIFGREERAAEPRESIADLIKSGAMEGYKKYSEPIEEEEQQIPLQYPKKAKRKPRQKYYAPQKKIKMETEGQEPLIPSNMFNEETNAAGGKYEYEKP